MAPTRVMDVMAVLCAATAGAFVVGVLLRLPAGGMFGAVIGAAVYRTVRAGPPLRRPYQPLGMALVGATAGASMRPDLFPLLTGLALPFVTSLVALLALWAVLALLLVRRFGFAKGTALLSTSPGGISAISSVAGESAVDVEVVVACHLLRVFVVVLACIPLLGFLLANGATS